MENKITVELIEKANRAKTAEELVLLTKEIGIDMSAEEAVAYFAKLNPQGGDVADEELENVAGGGCHAPDGRLVVTAFYGCKHWSCIKCGQPLTAHRKSSIVIMGGTQTSFYYCADGSEAKYECGSCAHCSYEAALLLCNHPANRS